MRSIRFTFLCNKEERRKLKTLAEHLHRSQGDTIRLLIHYASMKHGNYSTFPQLMQQKEITR